jgi:hypothetical protein
MAENIITNADDVDIVLESEVSEQRRGSPNSMGRIVADEFSINVGQTITSVSGVGYNVPAGLSKGDLEYSFSFVINGDDVTVMDMVSDDVGDSLPFSFTARKVDDNGDVQWEYALTTCLADTEELSGTTDESIQLNVEGLAVGLDKEV